MLRPAALTTSETWAIEETHDHLTIHGNRIWNKEDVPSTLSAGDTIVWSSDMFIHLAGWEICFSEVTGPTMTPSVTTVWQLGIVICDHVEAYTPNSLRVETSHGEVATESRNFLNPITSAETLIFDFNLHSETLELPEYIDVSIVVETFFGGFDDLCIETIGIEPQGTVIASQFWLDENCDGD